MPFSPPPIAELLAELQRVFAALGLRWFLFGAQAAILYGVARLSADVDVTGEARVPVVSAEDLVAMKRLGGRPRDVGDVDAILRLSELDRMLGLARRAGTPPPA